MSVESVDQELDKVIELSIGEINDLSIDDLLTYRKDGVRIKLRATDKFNIRWKNDALDVDPIVADTIIDAIKAINLQQEIKADIYKQYRSTFNRILEFQDSNNTLGKDLFNLSISKEKVIDDSDIEKFNSGLFNVDPRLSSLNGKVDYIVEKLQITDITEVVFLVLALMVSDKN